MTFTPIGAATPITHAAAAEGHPGAVRARLRTDECHPGGRTAVYQLHTPRRRSPSATSIRPPRSSLHGETQIWKITHNGVDTHAIHFHLFNVQVINRVGWDGAIRPPDPNELGWKETVRMNPLEDVIVALQADCSHGSPSRFPTAFALWTRRSRWAPRRISPTSTRNRQPDHRHQRS